MIIDLSRIPSAERFLACTYLAKPEVKASFFDDPHKLQAVICLHGHNLWVCNLHMNAAGERTVAVVEGNRPQQTRAVLAVAVIPWVAARHTAASILDFTGLEVGDWFDALRALSRSAEFWVSRTDEVGVTTKRALDDDGRLVERRIDTRDDRVVFTSRHVDLVAEALAATEGLPMPPAADNDCDEEDAQGAGGAA